MKTIILSLLILLISGCAKDYGRTYSSSVVVEFISSKKIFFYFLTPEQVKILGGHDVLSKDESQSVRDLVKEQYRYQTNGSPWEIKKGRHIIVADCNNYFFKQKITIKEDGQVMISCR